MARVADTLNQLDTAALTAALQNCCASTEWVGRMQQVAPFENDEQVETTAAQIWNALTPSDWLEAFEAHPRIGDVASLRAKYAATEQWAKGEQAGVAAASESTIERLAQQNAAYEAKFGHLFIVCATGKSADQMLALLDERIDNQPNEELHIAAAEQLKITLIRLRKLAT